MLNCCFYSDIKNQNVTIKKVATEDSMYQLLKENSTQAREEIAKGLNKTVRTIQHALDKLNNDGKIKRIGSNKTGYWEVF